MTSMVYDPTLQLLHNVELKNIIIVQFSDLKMFKLAARFDHYSESSVNTVYQIYQCLVIISAMVLQLIQVNCINLEIDLVTNYNYLLDEMIQAGAY